MPNVFKIAGVAPFNDWGGGVVEPAVWIFGGDLNLGENTIHNEITHTSHTEVANASFRRLTREV